MADKDPALASVTEAVPLAVGLTPRAFPLPDRTAMAVAAADKTGPTREARPVLREVALLV